MQNMTHFLALRATQGIRFALAMVDIDHFKRVNDHLGHLGGDQVLRDLAALLQGSFRDHDVVGRYGGEEFLVLISGVSAQQASRLFERLLNNVRHHPFTYQGECLHITISAGIVSSEEAGLTLERDTLLALADQRLYQAKADGRDRFVMGGEPA